MHDGSSQTERRHLEELSAEAKHARDRYRLYKAKTYGPRLTSPGRLRELERASNLVEGRLRRAQSESSGQLATGKHR
jgi:hypothetical protein